MNDDSLGSIRETFEARLMRLEDRYNELAVKVAKLDTKMNLIAFLAGSTFIAVVTGFGMLIFR